MTNYASYDDYLKKYATSKPVFKNAKDFNFFARQATQEIKQYTMNRIDENDIPEEVVLCCCELSERFFAVSEEESSRKIGIASESVGDWSTSYTNTTADEIINQKHAIVKSTIYKWLTGTGLLFRGLNIC